MAYGKKRAGLLARAYYYEAVLDVEAAKALTEHEYYSKQFAPRSVSLSQQAVEKALSAVYEAAGVKYEWNMIGELEQIALLPDGVAARVTHIAKEAKDLLHKDQSALRYPKLPKHGGLNRPGDLADKGEAERMWRSASTAVWAVRDVLMQEPFGLPVRAPYFRPVTEPPEDNPDTY